MPMLRIVVRLACGVLLAALVHHDRSLRAQGDRPDTDGHCQSGSAAIFACWNPQAGRAMGENIGDYAEFLPNLRGWDFRVNLPHVRFQRMRTGAGTPVTMVGVVEDATPLPDLHPSILGSSEYGHRSNAIWLLREEHGRVFAAQLPSRRETSTRRTENTAGPATGWFAIGQENAPRFQSFRVAATVAGRGLKAATLHAVAVDGASMLWHNRLRIDRTDLAAWPDAWQPIGVASRGAAALAAVEQGAVVLAYVDRARALQVQRFDAAAGVWSAPVTVAREVDPHMPKLVGDATGLHLLFSAGGRVRYSQRVTGAPLAFSAPSPVSSLLPAFDGQFDAMVFNGGVHVVIRTRTGEPANSGLFYAVTRSAPGAPAQWTIPSEVGLKAAGQPRIGALYDNVIVVVPDEAGRMRTARKDPNHVDNRITGGALTDRWIDVGRDVDPGSAGPFADAEVLSFNSDLYLTANQRRGSVDGTAQVVNLGRAVMKQVLTGKWGMHLLHGDGGVNRLSTPFGGAGETRMIADVNGDERSDLIRFVRTNVPGTGPAPVFVSRVIGNPNVGFTFAADELWHTFFSLPGEIPLVGDFTGDGRDDIVTFTQREQKRADGSIIGPAPVWVAPSTGSAFGQSSVWHTFFSLEGEIPLVGDFDGDGKDDIITFVQKLQRNADGSVLGQAPVWVSLSNGSSFGGSRVWHTFFSLAGEIPMVGDFNGDGKDDIATFVGHPHKDANGNVIAQAPVWVALSDGTRFGQSRIWHNFFAPAGELPRVADLDMDGRDDIVTFLQGTGQGVQARNVYTARSTGARFETSTTFASDQVRAGDLPFFGSVTAKALDEFTQQPADATRLLPDLYIFEPTGTTRIAQATGQVPFQPGAPWERYRWFPEKGLGAAAFPEWIHATGPDHCLSRPFRFVLAGAGGSGGAGTMVSSTRSGGRAEHILEELGHTLFANCLRKERDPFSLFTLIYETSMSAGGLDANAMPGCNTFDDCRDGEHFFLQLIKRYRLHGDEFRDRINNAADPAERARRRAQYAWLKQHWYRGAEFKLGPGADPIVGMTRGLLCLPGECAIAAPPPPPPPPPPTREECLRDCDLAHRACLAEGRLPRDCARERRDCRAECTQITLRRP